jgi:hypothetical protein
MMVDDSGHAASQPVGHQSPNRERQNAQAFLEERILRRIPVEVLVASLAITLGSLLFFSALTGLFILAGGAFSSASFLWLKNALNRFLSQDRKKAIRSGLIFYLVRLALLLSVFLIIIFLLPRMVLAFVAGFSTIVLVFFVEAVRSLSQIKTWKG